VSLVREDKEFVVKHELMKQITIELPDPQKQTAKPHDYPDIYTAIPPNGKTCAHTGLKHAQLYKLLTGDGTARRFVRVANIKIPGASKGKTVFQVGDMLRYLDWIAKQQGSGKQRIIEDEIQATPTQQPGG
jgi:hypothetical protein